MVTKIGLDLGYANITLSDSSAAVYREPSIALVDKETRRILSVGDSAVERTDPDPITILDAVLFSRFRVHTHQRERILTAQADNLPVVGDKILLSPAAGG